MARLYKSECYCTNMRRSAKAISDIYSDALSEVNLTAPQYYLLINLKRMESANMSDWSKRVGWIEAQLLETVNIFWKKE